MIRLKLNNPTEEFCLGVYCHQVQRITINEEDDSQTEEDMTRIIIGFLVFSIDIIW